MTTQEAEEQATPVVEDPAEPVAAARRLFDLAIATMEGARDDVLRAFSLLEDADALLPGLSLLIDSDPLLYTGRLEGWIREAGVVVAEPAYWKVGFWTDPRDDLEGDDLEGDDLEGDEEDEAEDREDAGAREEAFESRRALEDAGSADEQEL